MPTHITHGEVKLGKKPPKRLLKTLPLSNYMKASQVAYPPVCAWERPIKWGMLANDSLGDCTIAAALHMIIGWNAVAHAAEVPDFTDNDAIALYSAITGYVPGDPNTDQGAVETDVLNYWQNTGMGKPGGVSHQIAGYVSVDVGNQDMVKAATYLFGGLYLGISVPAYIMNVQAGGSWSTPDGHPDVTIEGGHAIPIIGYGRSGYTIVSWGTTYTFNPQFFTEYCDEAYAAVSTEWVKQSGITPSNVDLPQLFADLKVV